MSLRNARAAVSSVPEVEAAAEDLLGRGNAVDAVVAGVFAACAISPGALLGPVQILVGGAGAGILAIDGRVRQPGLGAPRPRGFTSSEPVPDAARVGVPWLPAALSVAIATMGSATFNRVMSPAVSLAKGTPRKDVLAAIASSGPRALEERHLAGELLALAGRPNGGLLTIDDLSSPQPDVQKASRTDVLIERAQESRPEGFASLVADAEPKSLVTFPWTRLEDGLPVPPSNDADVVRVRAVAAVDRNATFAIACWEEAADGLFIPELGLRAPFLAEPVRRGQTRVKPGDVREAAGAVALVGVGGSPDVALCAVGGVDAYAMLRDAITEFVSEGRIEARGQSRLFALTHANDAAMTHRS